MSNEVGMAMELMPLNSSALFFASGWPAVDFGQQPGAARQLPGGLVYLRPLRSAPGERAPEDQCVRAFDDELDYVFATLRRLGARPADIEDLAHDAFVVLLRNWSSLDPARPLRPYLFGILFRIYSAYRRRRLREVSQASPDSEDQSPGPEKAVQWYEANDLLHAALERVPLPRRAVIIMHDLDGVPIAEIAKALSITRFGAYARLHKGHRELARAVRRLQQGTHE
jgi:RNA polymerase sigma-70 factor (ECF subfamily)